MPLLSGQATRTIPFVSAKQLAASENQIFRLTRGDPVDVIVDWVKHIAVILDSGKLCCLVCVIWLLLGIFGIFGLAPLSHLRKLFSTNLRGVVYAYKFIFELTNFC